MKNTEFSESFIIGLLVVFLLGIITFEAFQQLFYIQRFDLANANNVSIVDLFKGQLLRWGVWLLFTPILWKFSLLKSVKIKFTSKDLLQYIGVIFILIFIAVFFISVASILINGDSFLQLITDYLPFFIYQKGLVFFMAYSAMSVVLYQYFINKKLQIKVEELSEVKKVNNNLYKKLSNQKIDDSSTVLNIKIGNKHKIIPIITICWIESDDYCVKIHTDNAISYSMRSSLKALENKLENNNFLRVHRNALVNMSMAKEMDFSNSPKLILENNTEISISKSKIKSVKDFLS
jgi:DNA-binding LytR/AlgR family response regulator